MNLSSIIRTYKKRYFDENNNSNQLTFRLTKRSTPIGLIYDIDICRIGPKGENKEIYCGVTQNKASALKIFDLLCENTVAPEHLIPIIDQFYEEMELEKV